MLQERMSPVWFSAQVLTPVYENVDCLSAAECQSAERYTSHRLTTAPRTISRATSRIEEISNANSGKEGNKRYRGGRNGERGSVADKQADSAHHSRTVKPINSFDDTYRLVSSCWAFLVMCAQSLIGSRAQSWNGGENAFPGAQCGAHTRSSRFLPRLQLLILLIACTAATARSSTAKRGRDMIYPDRQPPERFEEEMSDRYSLLDMPPEYWAERNAFLESIRPTSADVAPGAGAPIIPTLPPKFNLPPHELAALWDLYNATDGPHWRWFHANFTVGIPWNFTADPFYPCDPLWQGIVCTPTPQNGYYHIIGLDLQMHELRGPLPDSFFNLTQLHGFSLATNFLRGTVPHTIGQLTQVKVIDLSNNEFYGSLPAALADCTDLHNLYIYNNFLNGSLPSEIGNLPKLHVFKVTLNRLSGKLPPSYGNLLSLRLLYLGRNFFTGTIPESYGNLKNCTTFLLYENRLTGTLPEALVGLTNVSSFNVDVNYLSGTIPDFLGNMTSIVLLYLNENKFTGTIPESLALLPAIQNLYLHDNLLTGTIPAILSTMSSLLSLELSFNQLHGTIPEVLSEIPSLNILLLSGNHLTGTIPAVLGTMTTLNTLELAINSFTGTIPPSLGSLTAATNLYLYENALHGPVPEELGGMTNMVYLYLHENLLSGTLPHTLSNLSDLTSFFLQSNRFTGTLEGVFNGTRQPYLSLIQLSDNQLTGTIPDSIFALPELKTLVLVENCFDGTLPLAICNAPKLTTLGLDGIRSASSCQNVFFPRISTSYVLTSKVPGGVPLCLFDMPLLNTLHLSGNGLTGSLPGNLNVSDKLLDLALSHNKLTGSIPRSIQKKTWYNLDLSYNKFRGILYQDFATDENNVTFEHIFNRLPNRNITLNLQLPPPALSLRNNRLSNRIPSTIADFKNISVLYGNLFDCKLDESDLPEHDDGKDTYQCGSTSFNISYYLWMAMVASTFFVVFSIYYWRGYLEPIIGGVFQAIVYIKRWLNIVTWYDQENFRSKSRLHHYKYVMKVCEAMCSTAFYSTVYILVIALPMYAVTSRFYGTHTYEYAYSVSAAFLSGYPALAVLLVFFLLLMGLLTYLFRNRFRELRRFLHELPEDFHFSVLEEFEEEAALEASENKYSSWYEKAAIYAAFVLINFVIVGGVNIAYVYVVIYENSRYFTAAQIALSIFKLGWNTLGSVYLIRWTHHQIASSSTKDWKSKGAGFFAVQLFVSLFNFIGIPCLVVAAVSPNCFNNLVVDAPTVDSHYYFQACGIFSVHFGCILYAPVIASTSYEPPFTYSYECSSSLITYYAPSFVYMALIVTFVNPLLEVVMQKVHRMRVKGTWLAGQLDYWVPLVLQDVSAEEDSERAPYDIFNPYFDANLLLVNVVTYFGVLLTFGLVFPPLAVAILLSIYVVVYSNKIEVGRFLTNSIDQNLHKYMDIIESECHGVGSIPKMRQCVAMLIAFSCVFYTPFLFDTLGDSVGVDNAAWVVVFLPLFPLVIYAGHMLYIYQTNRMRTSSERRSHSVELRKSEFFRSKKAKELLEGAMVEEGSVNCDGNGHGRPSMSSEAESEDGTQYTVNVLQRHSRAVN